MKIGIIALCLSLVALGFGVFATVDTLGDENDANPPATSSPVSQWSEAECEATKEHIGLMAVRCAQGSEDRECDAYATLQLAINENCP
jgi:hypothetical protein